MKKWTQEELNEVYQKVLNKAVIDKTFREELLENPNKAIEKITGIPIAEDYKIRIIEQDPAYQATFFLPDMVSEEITAEELDEVAGGSCGANSCAGNGCAGQVTK